MNDLNLQLLQEKTNEAIKIKKLMDKILVDGGYLTNGMLICIKEHCENLLLTDF